MNLAAENPAAAQQLVDWLNTQGKKPGQLVNTGDEAYVNLTLLLLTLRGYDITPARIQDAENRIQSKPGRKLHYVQQQRLTVEEAKQAKPRTSAAKADDGTPFLGSDLVADGHGGYRTKTFHEQKRDREAAEQAKLNSQSQTSTLDASEQTWKSMADDLLRDGTHSQQARVREVYDRELGQGSFRHVYEACKKEVNAYKNRGIR
jgi:hypothetical protein